MAVGCFARFEATELRGAETLDDWAVASEEVGEKLGPAARLLFPLQNGLTQVRIFPQ